MSKMSEWYQLQQQLKVIKEQEAVLRRELVAEIIQGKELKNGRLTVKTVVDGFACKAVQELSYNLDKAILANIWGNLTAAERNVIRLVPELKLGDYKKLPLDVLLHEAVVSKPAMPTLEALPPVE